MIDPEILTKYEIKKPEWYEKQVLKYQENRVPLSEKTKQAESAMACFTHFGVKPETVLKAGYVCCNGVSPYQESVVISDDEQFPSFVLRYSSYIGDYLSRNKDSSRLSASNGLWFEPDELFYTNRHVWFPFGAPKPNPHFLVVSPSIVTAMLVHQEMDLPVAVPLLDKSIDKFSFRDAIVKEIAAANPKNVLLTGFFGERITSEMQYWCLKLKDSGIPKVYLAGFRIREGIRSEMAGKRLGGEEEVDKNHLGHLYRYSGFRKDVIEKFLKYPRDFDTMPLNRRRMRKVLANPHLEIEERFSPKPFGELITNQPNGEVYCVVPRKLPRGLCVFGAKKKQGKTRMCYNLAYSVIMGTKWLDAFVCDPGEVLFFDLEDDRDGTYAAMVDLHRSELMKSQDEAPTEIQLPEEITARLHMAYRAKGLDNGVCEAIKDYLEAHEDIRLVIIDNLKKIKPRAKGIRTAQDDYFEAEPLQELALMYDVAIVVVVHSPKMRYEDPYDAFEGTTGLTDVATTLWVLQQAEGSKLSHFYMKGRKTPESILAVEMDNFKWRYVGDVEDVHVESSADKIVSLLDSSPEKVFSNAEIHQITDGSTVKKEKDKTTYRLQELVNAGRIVKVEKGKYQSVSATYRLSGNVVAGKLPGDLPFAEVAELSHQTEESTEKAA